MKTAVYTICKNEINRIGRWFQYAEMFDYIVVLDTGSIDDTWRWLVDKSYECDKLIIKQKIFEPFNFSEARNHNLSMIPNDVDWCLSPDIDEWFSINVLDEIQRTVKENPDVTNISTTRLDIYSKEVFVGPPNHIPSNKIHLRYHYHWKQPIYEHLWPYDLSKHKEVYNDKIFLIHDQDITKPRGNHYLAMMKKRYEEDPTDCWNNWYLLNHYYRESNVLEYTPVALDFLKHSKHRDKNFEAVYNDVKNIYKYHTNQWEIPSLYSKMREVLNDIRI